MTMLRFLFHRSHLSQPTPAIQQALARQGLPGDMDLTTLSVVQRGGSYSGRKVQYFRLFDPGRSAERGIDVSQYADLDNHPELILGYGHLESDGAVVVSRRAPTPSTERPDASRINADRTVHTDDEAVVFPGRAQT
jgi:hypothetical protein